MTKFTVTIALLSLLALHPAGETAIAKPEDVGLSTERLVRVTEMMKRHGAASEISGGLAVGPRHDRDAHPEAVRGMDADSKKPMTKDAVVRLASMNKPGNG